MPCGFHLAETVAEWERTPRPIGWKEIEAVRRGNVFARRRLGVLLAAGPAGHRRDRDAGRDLRPRRVRRDVAARQLDAARAEPGADPLARSARDVRLPLVRSVVDDALAGRPRGLGPALPGLPRQGGRQPVPAVPAPRCDRRPGRGGARGARASGRPSPGASAAAPTGRRDGRLLRGPGRRVRRLVSPPRPLLPRPDPRRGLERRARRRRDVAGRPADPGRDRRAGGRHRLVVAAPRLEGRAVDLRRGRGAARPRPRTAGRPSPPRPHPRPRRVGGAGSRRSTRCSAASG